MLQFNIKNDKKILVDTINYFIGKIIPGIIGFFSIPIILRLYGETIYGEYSLLISTVLLLSTFWSGWIGQTFMRYYSLKSNKTEYTYFNYKILFLSNLLLSPLLFIGCVVWGKSYLLSGIVASGFFFLSLFSFLTYEMKTKLYSRRVVIGDLIRSILFISIVISPIFIKNISFDLNILFIANLISYVLGCIYFKSKLLQPKTTKKIINIPIDKKQLSEMVKYGLPLALWMITAYLLNISDRFIIKYYYSYEEVGIYSAIYDIFSKLISLVFAPLLIAIQPIIIKYYNSGLYTKVRKYLINSILLQIFIFIILFILLQLFRGYFIENLIKVENPMAYKLILPIFIAAFLWNISLLIHKPMELKNKTKIMLLGIIISFLVNLIGNLIFIPLYGIIAAAYTTLVGVSCYLLFIIINSRGWFSRKI